MTPRTTGPGVLSERTRRTYATAWSLFTDWCAVTSHPELPADPATVLAFLTDCPAARKTHRGWVDAIDHRHTAHGFDPPGRSAAVLAALADPPANITVQHLRRSTLSRRRCGRCPVTVGHRGSSVGGIVAYWCCPNWRGCRTGTWPR
jgi:hypothetical protein